MARQAFSDAFAHLYDPVLLARFLDEAYRPGDTMERGLADPVILWQVAAIADRLVGYAKLSPLAAPAPTPRSLRMELQQIDVLALWHERGVAEGLIHWALDPARVHGAPEIYLMASSIREVYVLPVQSSPF